MRTRAVLAILLAMSLLPISSAAETKGGVNIEPIVEETIFSDINHTETTRDLDQWEITLTLNEDAYSNNTTFTLTTQICINEGVCFAPEKANLSTDDNKTFTSSVTTMDDHTYVNWKIQATYPDDNDTVEKFPASGYYKTWSDCWYNDGEWGGDGCPDTVGEKDSDGLPAVGVLFTAGIVMLAAISRRSV